MARKKKSQTTRRPNREERWHIDRQENIFLEEAIRGQGCFENLGPVQGKNQHELAIEYLEDLLGRWCRTLVEAPRQQAQTRSHSNRPPPSRAYKTTPIPTPVLVPFGSYRLGVHSTTSDLDLLAVAAAPVQRSNFFTSFVHMLENDNRCHHVHPIPTAYTPVIKLRYVHEDAALPIDLVFARVANRTKLMEYQRQKKSGIQNVQYKIDDSDLHDLDEKGILSLNGVRVTQIILESVPKVANFQTVLRAVKHWAHVKGIYSNALGFLGGVNWALLVAHVCLKYPSYSTSHLMRAFFRCFATWDWKTRPVILNGSIADVPPMTDVSGQSRAIYMQAWNPQKNPRDGTHVMPIITPAYTSMNSSYNVDIPQLCRIQAEMASMHNFLRCHKKEGVRNPFMTLFRASDFFYWSSCFGFCFLRIKIMANNEQHFVKWFHWVEANLRSLIISLGKVNLNPLPFAKFFERDLDSPHERDFFVALRFTSGVKQITETFLRPITEAFLQEVKNWNMHTPDMELQFARVSYDCRLYPLSPLPRESNQTTLSTNDDDEAGMLSCLA